jgi:L,D-transpeptidase catalytic domain
VPEASENGFDTGCGMRSWLTAIAALTGAACLLGGGQTAADDDDGARPGSDARAVAPEPGARASSEVSRAGSAPVPTVQLRRATAINARPGGRPVGRLSIRTPYGSRTRLWVRARQGRWLKVSTPDAPGAVGWIDRRRVRPAPPVASRIEIDRSRRRLTVLAGGRRWSTRVVVGAPASPTPLGVYQVTDRLRGERFAGAYGAHILVLSAYGSPSRTSRLAVHGVPPAARSFAYSAGCVRVPRRALERLARETPPGTPVRILA